MENNVKITGRNSGASIFSRTADDVLENTKEKGNRYLEMAKVKGQKTLGLAKGFIQKNPGQAVGYAVLLGLAVGALLLYSKGNEVQG